MAEVNAKDLTTKTAPASTDSMLLFGTTTNEGAKITVDNLAENILSRISTKTFPNQVGGSSAATILAQLATLNSNIPSVVRTGISNEHFSILVQYAFGKLRVLFFGNFKNLAAGANLIEGIVDPAREQITTDIRSSNNVNYRLTVKTNGDISIYNYGSEIAEANTGGFITYFVN